MSILEVMNIYDSSAAFRKYYYFVSSLDLCLLVSKVEDQEHQDLLHPCAAAAAPGPRSAAGHTSNLRGLRGQGLWFRLMKVSPPSLAGCAAAAATLSARQHRAGQDRTAEVPATVGGFSGVTQRGRYSSGGRFAAHLFVPAVQVLAMRQAADLSAAQQVFLFWHLGIWLCTAKTITAHRVALPLV